MGCLFVWVVPNKFYAQCAQHERLFILHFASLLLLMDVKNQFVYFVLVRHNFQLTEMYKNSFEVVATVIM